MRELISFLRHNKLGELVKYPKEGEAVNLVHYLGTLEEVDFI